MLIREVTREENSHLKQLYDFYLFKEIPIEPIESVRKAILNDEYLMRLYGANDIEGIINRYFAEVYNVREALREKDKEQNIANCLEYIRFTCMGENFEGIEGIRYFEALSDSEISSAILGKGTSISQSRFMRDILPEGIPCSVSRVDYYDYPQGMQMIKSDDCLIFQTRRGIKYLNPFSYLENRRNSVNKIYHDDVEQLQISAEKTKIARKKVGELIIDKLGIRDIVRQITTENMTPEKKNAAFVNYIKQNAKQYDVPVKHNGIIVNGKLLEVSKLLELFYIASNIPYKVVDRGQKENDIYVIKSSEGGQIVTDVAQGLQGRYKSLEQEIK